jgi:D-alanyl-D-alanine carboxypeptidase
VLEEPCGAVLHELNAGMRLPPASLTKIATALVAIEQVDLVEMVTVEVSGGELSASTDATVMGIEPGQRLSILDLLYGMLLPSGNDAAIAIAQHVSGSQTAFVTLMNGMASELGLSDTQFTNPHGLDDPGLYTSAYDIAMMGRELLRDPGLAHIVRTQSYQPAWEGPAMENHNLLLSLYPGALGLKTGYTDLAGQTLVAAAERSGRRIIVSVLRSQDVYVDAIALLDWGFESAPTACGATNQEMAGVGR